MALFIISIPLMVVAVALAIVPLIVASHSEHRRPAAESGNWAGVDSVDEVTDQQEGVLVAA